MPEYSTPNGESQLSSGVIDDSGTLSKISRTKTAPAKNRRIPTCPRVRKRWSLAEISVPITQMAVITAMITTARSRDRHVVLVERLRVAAVRLAAGKPEEVEEVVGRDVGQGADHQDAGRADRPAAEPAHPRAHPARDPGERRPAVRVDAVHVEERRRDEEHRDERDEQDRRRLDADRDHDRADHRRERVGRAPSRRGRSTGRRGTRSSPSSGPSRRLTSLLAAGAGTLALSIAAPFLLGVTRP